MRKPRAPVWELAAIAVIVVVVATTPGTPLQRDGYALFGALICATAAGVAFEVCRRLYADTIGRFVRRLR